MPNINDKIRQFLDDMPDVAGFSKDDAKYISQYTGCSVPEHAIIVQCQEIIKEKFPFITLDFQTGVLPKALCYGYGSDRVVSNTNAIITSYQEDYYCFRVTQAVHYDKVVSGDHSVTFRNLADYFANYKGNNLKYDIVVVFPQNTDYHSIVDKSHKDTSSFAYYTLAGAYFLKQNGILISVVPNSYFKEIHEYFNGFEYKEGKFNSEKIGNNHDYSIIKITKG